jgi:hypothetical protein
MQLPHFPNILLIAGSGRNVGKTTLAEALVKRYAPFWPIVGLKVSSVYTGEEQQHGKKPLLLQEEYHIMEEFDRSGAKDTSRLLLAGASRSFYIRAHDDQLQAAIDAFWKIVSRQSIIVCESGSLRLVLVPGLFLLLKQSGTGLVKPRITKLEPLADKVIDLQNQKLTALVDQIQLSSRGWGLR